MFFYKKIYSGIIIMTSLVLATWSVVQYFSVILFLTDFKQSRKLIILQE